MTRRRVSNPLALAVLACLGERPMHPYEISSTLRQRGKEESIKLNFGSLYSVVAALEKHGLVVEQERVREGNRPERTIYAITLATPLVLLALTIPFLRGAQAYGNLFFSSLVLFLGLGWALRREAREPADVPRAAPPHLGIQRIAAPATVSTSR